LIKPASYDCNLACDYCYYRPVEAIYGQSERPRMSAQTFEAACRQYMALRPREIKIGWQGGEPTLMGLEFFRTVVRIEREHARPGECVGNSLQTNGVLLDDGWCRFLAANRFLVGLSIDGPERLNTMRRFPNGRSAFDLTMAAIELLKKHRVEFNILVVISRANMNHPREILRFLVDNELRYSQFIPCTEPAGEAGCTSEHSVTAAEYGRFMTDLFDAWVENDDPSYYVRRIDNWLHQFFGLEPECCEYRGNCSDLITLEWNGDVYPCDFFVEERYRMGNVHRETIEKMLQGRAFRSFVRDAETIPPMCESCEVLQYCRAGCYRHRRKLGLSNTARPYLCEAKRRIFGHVMPRLKELKDRGTMPGLHRFLNQIGADLAGGQREPRPQQSPRRRASPLRSARRNDPCPCGSGRKFKQCCGKRPRAQMRR
jgi:uncharacterized protein